MVACACVCAGSTGPCYGRDQPAVRGARTSRHRAGRGSKCAVDGTDAAGRSVDHRMCRNSDSWFVCWRRVAAVLRTGTPIREGREINVLRWLDVTTELISSPSHMQPGVFGILRPAAVDAIMIGSCGTRQRCHACQVRGPIRGGRDWAGKLPITPDIARPALSKSATIRPEHRKVNATPSVGAYPRTRFSSSGVLRLKSLRSFANRPFSDQYLMGGSSCFPGSRLNVP